MASSMSKSEEVEAQPKKGQSESRIWVALDLLRDSSFLFPTISRIIVLG
jgi:hypothetical protein